MNCIHKVPEEVSKRMHRHWFHYLITGVAALGALATWSRWCRLPNGMGYIPKALGLHFYEGWIVFLMLAFVAGLHLLKVAENKTANIASSIMSIVAVAMCLVFTFRFGPEEACNALWISLIGAAIALVFSIGLWVKYASAEIHQKNKLNN